MGSLTLVRAFVRDTLDGWRSLRLAELQYAHRHTALLVLAAALGIALAVLVARVLRARVPGRHGLALPAMLPERNRLRTAWVRHAPLLLFACGLPLLFLALADPSTPQTRSQTSYPGRRISVLIDASSSMIAPFTAATLNKNAQADIAFTTSVAAAEQFMRMRIKGRYHDLIALIEFGDEAYVVTPFTSDYENILLSISLIGDINEWGNFPDQGTIIAQAIEQSVELYKAFDFLKASGNVMVIFSDGQDTQVSVHGRSVYDILEGAVKTKVPVYFIRTSYNRQLGGLIPDDIWKPAVERTGGRFYAASNEATILQAIEEIDSLATGRIDVMHYSVRRSRFDAFASAAVAIWSLSIALALTVPHFRRFP